MVWTLIRLHAVPVILFEEIVPFVIDAPLITGAELNVFTPSIVCAVVKFTKDVLFIDVELILLSGRDIKPKTLVVFVPLL